MLPLYIYSIFNNISGTLPIFILSFLAGVNFGTIPLLILKIFDIHLYKIKDRSKISIIKNHINNHFMKKL